MICNKQYRLLDHLETIATVPQYFTYTHLTTHTLAQKGGVNVRDVRREQKKEGRSHTARQTWMLISKC